MEYKAEADVMDAVRDLVANHHPHLALYVDEIAVIFKDKTSKIGDAVVLGKTAKAPAILNVLGDGSYKFIITLAANEWKDLSGAEQLALLDHHLCGCRVQEEDSGAIKTWVQPPDVAFYKGELERHGTWRTSGTAASPDLIQQLFGDD